MAYPDNLSNLPANHTDFTGTPASAPDTAKITAATVNTIETAINGLETTLGLNPEGASADVAARLTATDAAVAGKADATATTAALAGKADAAATTTALAGKAPTVHVHSAADVTSGTLPLTRGGTGGTDAATARTSLGLGTAATQPATAFEAAGAAAAAVASSAQRASNLADLASAATARTNLGLGTAATQPVTAFAPAAAVAGLGAPSTATTGTLVAGQMALVDATSAACARTLPAANSVPAGTVTGVKKIDASVNAVTVSRAGADTITGTAAGQTSRALTLAGESVELTSDGVSVWVITSTDTPSPSLTGTYARLAPDWITGRAYVVGELVVSGGTLYRCSAAHTSSGSIALGNFTALGGGGGAPLADPAFTGNPTAPTQAEGDSDTSIATTGFVERATGTTLLQALGAGSGTRAISTAGKWVTATLTGNTTFTFPAPASSRAYTFTVEVIQDATGGRTVTWPGSVLWPNGSAPALPSAPNAVGLFQFTSRDAGLTWYGSPQFAAAAVNGTPETMNTQATAGPAQTVPDPTVATINFFTLTAATCTLTFPAAGAGKSMSIVLRQDATGGRLVTWPGAIVWVGSSGVAPVLSASGGKVDVFTFMCADGTNWLGMYGGGS